MGRIHNTARPLWWRDEVGGLWDTIGKWQFDLLVNLGLRPDDRLLDIGCGCFRSGRFFLDYLDAGNYYGIDPDSEITDLGIKHELNEEQRGKLKLLNDGDFNFSLFVERGVFFQYALAQSVFTHLPKEALKRCSDRLLDFLDPTGLFIMTIFKKEDPKDMTWPEKEPFRYSIEQVREVVGQNWIVIPTSISHQRGQVVLVLVKN